MDTKSFLGVLVGLMLVNPCAAFLQNLPRAEAAGRFCTSSHYVTMGGERVKVCCANGLCTTKYGVYNN